MNTTDIETSIARYCGAALAGIKSACLMRLSKEVKVAQIAEIENSFCNRDIKLRVLKAANGTRLLLAYRQSVLAAQLSNTESKAFLKSFGYCENLSVESCLEMLEKRLNEHSFPHEIGVFLGYPLDDIRGFIADPKRCEYCGLWKVYGGVDEKKRLFERYQKCNSCIEKRLQKGENLAEIIVQ